MSLLNKLTQIPYKEVFSNKPIIIPYKEMFGNEFVFRTAIVHYPFLKW